MINCFKKENQIPILIHSFSDRSFISLYFPNKAILLPDEVRTDLSLSILQPYISHMSHMNYNYKRDFL